MRVFAFTLIAWLCFSPGLGHAQQPDVPQDLKPWQPWVMYGQEFRRCPMRHAATGEDSSMFVCAWPGRVRIDVSASGGEFSQRWRVYADTWIALPGDTTHWPEDVRVNGAAAPATAQDDVPSLRLGPGEYSISGKFSWSRRPESLQLPAATALVDLTIDGKPVAPVDLRDDRLWLGAVRTVTVPRAMQIEVYRLLDDGIPVSLMTQIHLKVSGDAREELLARALPQGFVPMSVAGDLPARFEPDGRLRVQVRSGEHVLEVRARAAAPGDSITTPEGDGPWAQSEIWSYRSNDRLRVSAIEAASIDAAQAGVPREWRAYPAFRLDRGATIAIAERSRGLSSQDANRLSLERSLWLAFDHTSFVAADRIVGTMQQGWRLDMLSPYRLLNARRFDETMLITDAPEGRTGIEVRTPALDVTTLSQVPAGGRSPATGWDARFESVSTTLHLPPGHRLLAAWGVDESPDAWLNQWQLLDLFLLMLVAAAAYRLAGWIGAAIAAAVIVLTHVELYAPAWLWINLLIAVAVVRALPDGRLRTWASGYQLLSFAALVIVLVPFAIQQYRFAFHPQLEIRPDIATMMLEARQTGSVSGLTNDVARLRYNAPLPEVSVATDAAPAAAPAMAIELPRRLDRYAPGAVLQTGPGIPDWHYLSYHLRWSGPVDAQQTLRLAILSPFWMSLWRIAGLLLSAALLVLLVRIAYGGPRNWRLSPWQPAASAAALVVLLTLAHSPHAAAQTPDAALLTELKKRLSEPAKCAPDCAQVVLATVDVSGDRLDVQMEAHAQAHVALGMPQAGPQWIVERVLIDEQPSDALARPFELLQIPLTPGVHRVRVSGRIVQADELALEFPQPPRRIAVRAAGWDYSGTSEGRLLNNALQLTRRLGANAQKATAPQRFPPFVRIERRLSMNLDWTLSTSVVRLAPDDGAFTLSLPLLPGEAVLTPGFEVRDGRVLVSMPSGEKTATWESALSQVDRLQWSAAADQPWVEQWDVIVSPMWHAEFSGTPPIMPAEYVDGVWVNQFLPRPGESLSLAVQRPVGSAGTTLAVDRVNLATAFGRRLSNTTLDFSYRSSQGGRHDLRVPKDARVSSVSVDGTVLSLRPTDGVLPLTVMPGAHTVVVTLSADEGAGITSRPPALELGTDGTNVRTTVVVPADRWVLFAWGSGIGPAILYWGELLVFAAIALALGRSKRTPLRTRDWLLLGLGLSTFSWWVLLVFGTWLFVMDRRSEWRLGQRVQFNALQLALALFSLVAIVLLISAIPFGLLGQPDMGIRSEPTGAGPGLSWFLDSTGSQLPQPMVLSVSIWYYKIAMLLWAMWLSFALLRWLPWAWRQYSAHGWWMSEQDEDRAAPQAPQAPVAGEA